MQRLDGKHALLRAGAAASGCVSEAAMIAAAFLASRLPAGRSECAPKTAGPAGSEWLHRIGHGTAGLGRIIFGMAAVASQLSQRLRVCGRVHACACRVGREQVTVGCDVIPKIQRTKYLCDRKLLATVTKKDWRACSCRERAAPIASVSSGPMPRAPGNGCTMRWNHVGARCTGIIRQRGPAQAQADGPVRKPSPCRAHPIISSPVGALRDVLRTPLSASNPNTLARIDNVANVATCRAMLQRGVACCDALHYVATSGTRSARRADESAHVLTQFDRVRLGAMCR